MGVANVRAFWQRAEMRLSLILTLVYLGGFFVPAHAATPADQLHTFYGILKVVDPVAKTFTIKSGAQLLVFHYNDQTKISREGGYVSWTTLKPGVGANVQMRLGEGNIGIAVKVRFVFDQGRAESMALFSVRTVKGERISGIAISNYVVAEPPPDVVARDLDLGTASGIFRATVRPDGTVDQVTTVRSLGWPEANQRGIRWVKKWKFKPHSVTEFQVPVSIVSSHI